MNFNRVNNITGWIVCIIACIVYLMTMEATGSLWDCGEFISAAYKVQVPHPPGAPLFVLLGRVFTLPFSPSEAAIGVNTMSALASGFTILFLFWTITHFARRIMAPNGETMSSQQMITVMGAGVVGALAYTFSDSFWFSAVEGEVYAMSSLFTAVVFWAMLKWEHEADSKYGDRWIVLIAYLMGLSIGVHLLNLLTIPAMVLIYYYKRNKKITLAGTIWAFLLGCALTGLVQKFIIQDTIKVSGMMDVFFVNSLSMPFFSGFTFYFVAILALLILGYFKPKLGLYAPLVIVASVLVIPAFADGEGTGMRIFRFVAAIAVLLIPYFLKMFDVKLASERVTHGVKLVNACIVFLLMGYSTYVTTMIRSSADPSVDMYNVDNPVSLVGYLGREQYGDFPLIYGQVFTARPDHYDDAGKLYARIGNKYVVVGNKQVPVYKSEDMMLFPRVWDASNDQGHADYYRAFLGLKEGEKPSFGDNIYFFFKYQVSFMYLRYFGWNFIGKQNDIQGFGNPRDGNTISGVAPIDNLLYGNQSDMPDSLKNSKAHNVFFFLPFLLGLIGFFFHYNRHKRDTFIVGLLFFFTGFAIVLYLNQAGNQPRERDYAYVGSFYAFAIWIGLGVLSIYTYLASKKIKVAAVLATLLSLIAVPVLMAQQGWDDHDRSKKVIARDVAKDYLESCAPNAILFTVGDNDTYPLWYAQEVEGIRPDIRVINLSLLSAEWYIEQQRKAVNESPAIPMTLTPDKYQGDARSYVMYYDNGKLPQDRAFDLGEVLNFVSDDRDFAKVPLQNGEKVNYLPTKHFFIPVDKGEVVKLGVVDAQDSSRIVPGIQFSLPENKNVIFKGDLAVYDIIATNKWKRPIYFTSPVDMGFNEYLQVEGLTYRLVPTRKNTPDEMLPGLNDQVNTGKMYKNLMTKFAFGSVNVPGVYFDEPNRRMLQSLRNAYTKLGVALVRENQKGKALEVLNKQDQMFLPGNMPYAMTTPSNMHNLWSMEIVYAYYLAGDKKKAEEISNQLIKDMEQQMRYYRGLPDRLLTNDLQDDAHRAEQFTLMLKQWKMDFAKRDSAQQTENGQQFSTVPDSGK